MTTTTYTDFATMLEALRELASQAASVEGADDVGAFHPIPMPDKYRAYGEFSSLSEFLDDFADVLQAFVDENIDEIGTWSA